jgi:serine/threonine-protein kinase
VAVKQLRPERRTQTAVAALLEEARCTGLLEHPNVVPVHALGRSDDGAPVLVMKRVEGISWRELIHDEHHPAWQHRPGDRLVRHLEILMQVANAVHFAHRRGVVHRDIKPENVMLGDFGEVYLVDWGVALRLERKDDVFINMLVGTPAYMAPEMLAGGEGVGPWSDVYLLGATLHEVLTGAPRHGGDSMVHCMVEASRTAPVAYPPSVPAELAAIANRATALDPKARFGSALEFRDAIAEHLHHRGSLSLSGEASRRLEELAAAPADGAVAPDEEAADLRFRRLAAECRFGFEQSLREWPDNTEAQQGRVRCLELATAFELKRGNAGGAAALLAELPSPRPELVAELEALRARRREELQARDQLTRILADQDLRVGARARAAGLLLLAVAAGVLFLQSTDNRVGAVDHRMLVTLSGTLTALVVVMSLVSRRQLLQNRVGRHVAAAFILDLLLVTIHRVLALETRQPIAAVLVGDLLIGTTVAAMAGIFIGRMFLGVAAVLMCGAAVAAGAPRQAVIIYTASTLGALFLMMTVWLVSGGPERHPAPEEPEPPPPADGPR